ncbi:MAG: hypothetical protein L0L05_06530, partial [Yaniella sp.]|nr:hypothetical protein [Yaniella sp.]
YSMPVEWTGSYSPIYEEPLCNAGIELVELPQLSFFSPILVIDLQFAFRALQAISAIHNFVPEGGRRKSPWTIR